MDKSPGSGVILFAGSSSSSSSSPDSPSSGYQTVSSSSSSRPSSPEEPSPPSPSTPKLTFHLPDVPPSAPPCSRKPSAPFTEAGGVVLLCMVCGDVASGFHYGVHTCEGCKGFFRRSIQQIPFISYKMCVKNESCQIIRGNRNRCQHCRFKKCLSVGMARDAVRFGRIPKQEKLRLLDKIQKSMKGGVEFTTPHEAPPTQLSSSFPEGQLESRNSNSSSQHPPTCPGQDRLTPTDAENTPTLLKPHPPNSSSPGTDPKFEASCFQRAPPGSTVLGCPLNWCPVSSPGVSSQQVWDLFTRCFVPAVKDVVEFSRSIPGFQSIHQSDQIQLLQSGTFQVLMVQFCTLFDAANRSLRFQNGLWYPLDSLKALGMGPLLDAMLEFSHKLRVLQLDPDELALFKAVVLLSADRSGISDVGAVERLQEELIDSLRSLLRQRRPYDRQTFPKLLLRLPDLQNLNCLHSEKLLAFHVSS